MNRRYFKLKLSDATTDEGVIEGHLSVKDNVDLGGDVVKAGAFKRTLAATGGRVPILFNHSVNEPIGAWEEMREDDVGLYVKGRLNMEVSRAREIFALLKQGAIKGLSIGYDVVKDRVIDGKRHLLELKLWEGSVVVFPMNERAGVEAVKAHAAENKFMRSWGEMNDRNQCNAAMRVAFGTLEDALITAAWSQEVDDDEAAAFIDEALGQFHAAVLDLFRRKRGYAQADMGENNKTLALHDERLVVFMSKVDQTIKALQEEVGKSDSGNAHSDETTEAGPADEPQDSGEAAHSADSKPLAGLLEAIQSATPPPLE